MPPLACESHWIWALYAPPILIVAGSILANKIRERRRGEDER